MKIQHHNGSWIGVLCLFFLVFVYILLRFRLFYVFPDCMIYKVHFIKFYVDIGDQPWMVRAYTQAQCR